MTFFLGVWAFIVALATEFVPLPPAIFYWLFNLNSTLGSFLFVLGGAFECVECDVFTSLKLDSGWIGAYLNTLGGSMFLVGSVFGFFPGQGFKSSFLFGIGALIFAGGSGFMIIMWKDEQFGLTFLSALNNLEGQNGRPIVHDHGTDEVQEEHTGSIFVMVYCLAGAMSFYEFLLTLKGIDFSAESTMHAAVRTFNAFLPCVLSHLLLAVNSAAIKVPHHAPFRQLYIGCRFLALMMVISATMRMVGTLQRARHNEYLYCERTLYSECISGDSHLQALCLLGDA